MDTPKGKALAIIFQDYGFDHHNLWTCVVEETGEIWTFQNPEVKARADYTFGVRQEARKTIRPLPTEHELGQNIPRCPLCEATKPCIYVSCRFPVRKLPHAS